MARIKGLTLSRNNVSQTINLEDILGVSFVGERSLRLAIAQRVLDYIRERTEDGKDVRGNPLSGPYSKDYQESTVFKLLGKSANDINMTLTGNMLSSMDVLGDGASTFVIGFGDQLQRDKAYNHNVGGTVPARKFFGIRQGDLRDLVEDEFGDEIERLRGQEPGSLNLADLLRAIDRAPEIQTVVETLTLEDVLNGQF